MLTLSRRQLLHVAAAGLFAATAVAAIPAAARNRISMDALILRASVNSLSAARSLGRAGLRVVVASPPEDPAVRHSRYVSRFVALDALENLFAMHRDFFRRGDADADLVAFDTEDRHGHGVADHQGLAYPPGQNQHTRVPRPGFVLHRTAAASEPTAA